ncbi:PAS domain S-box protein [Jeongeupia naejangsanensis]|uniref:PAS domain S-box protein n=1 Tax=Jeongeupia naejangsanensis TaxID=613195 RepID=A0ABS2BMF5_9NEIS|nr:PAS domain S-box protein [Jeongeupia naejangsanensis]MBM3116743.1 PAS domain S-box protein [Jeongeupia naejangsanensis]
MLALIVFAVGLCMSWLVSQLLVRIELRALEGRFRAEAQSVAVQLTRGIANDLGALRASARYMALSPSVSASQFGSFVEPYLDTFGGIAWVRPEAGDALRVRYAEPGGSQGSFVGSNLSADPIRGEVLRRAQARHGMATSPVMALRGDYTGEHGFAIAIAVFRPGEQTPYGFVWGTYRLNLLQAQLNRIAQERGVMLALEDESGRTVAESDPGIAAGHPAQLRDFFLPLLIGDRTVTLRVTAAGAFARKGDWVDISAVWLPGTVIPFLLALLVYVLANRQGYAEALAVSRARELKQSEQRLRRIFHAIDNALFLVDAQWSVRKANQAAESLLHDWHIEQADGVGVFAHVARLAELDEAIAALLAGGEPFLLDRVIDGHSYAISGVRVARTGASVDDVLIRVADLSEQRRTLLELQDTRAYLGNVLDAASRVSIIATDNDGQIGLFNRGAEYLLGYRSDEVVGSRSMLDFIADREIDGRRIELEDELGQAVGRFEALTLVAERSGMDARVWTHRTRSGDVRQVELTVTRIVGAQGNRVGYLCIGVDITERLAAEAALIRRDRLLSKLSERVPGLIYQYQRFPDGRSVFPYASDGIQAIYGVSPEAAGADATIVLDRIVADDMPMLAESIDQSAQQLSLWRCDYRVDLPQRGVRWLRGESSPERQEDGSTIWYGFISDITEQKKASDQIALLASVIEASSLGVLIVDAHAPDLPLIFVNSAFEHLSGYARHEVLGRNCRFLQGRDRLQPEIETVRRLIAERRAGRVRLRNYRKDGSPFWNSLSLTPLTDTLGTLTHYIGVCEDISDRVEAQNALAASEEKFRTFFESSPVGMALIRHSDGHFVDANTAFCNLLGYGVDDLRAQTLSAITPAEYALQDRELVYELYRQQRYGPYEKEYLHRAGHRVPVLINGFLMPSKEGGQGLAWCIVEDISEQKRLQRELEQMSITDPLTLLYNRRYFNLAIEREVGRVNRNGVPLSLLMFDLDHFKRINDQFGHDVGDKVLQHFALLVRQRVRATDIFCRLGGEEFLLVCPDTDFADAERLAKTLLASLRDEPFEVVGRVTASIGVTQYQPFERIDAALKRVDNLVYAAKDQGRDRIVTA